jgi:hypothetical protein
MTNNNQTIELSSSAIISKIKSASQTAWPRNAKGLRLGPELTDEYLTEVKQIMGVPHYDCCTIMQLIIRNVTGRPITTENEVADAVREFNKNFPHCNDYEKSMRPAGDETSGVYWLHRYRLGDVLELLVISKNKRPPTTIRSGFGRGSWSTTLSVDDQSSDYRVLYRDDRATSKPWSIDPELINALPATTEGDHIAFRYAEELEDETCWAHECEYYTQREAPAEAFKIEPLTTVALYGSVVFESLQTWRGLLISPPIGVDRHHEAGRGINLFGKCRSTSRPLYMEITWQLYKSPFNISITIPKLICQSLIRGHGLTKAVFLTTEEVKTPSFKNEWGQTNPAEHWRVDLIVRMSRKAFYMFHINMKELLGDNTHPLFNQYAFERLPMAMNDHEMPGRIEADQAYSVGPRYWLAKTTELANSRKQNTRPNARGATSVPQEAPLNSGPLAEPQGQEASCESKQG